MEATVEEKLSSIEKSVEKYFKEDIDTLLRQEYENFNIFIRKAEKQFRTLMDRVYAGKNKWRPGAWNVIKSHLQDEREYVGDVTDVTTICTYALYIEAAFLYLRDGCDRKKVTFLREILMEDLRPIGDSLTSECANDMPESDKEIVAVALLTAAAYIEWLGKEYPDT